MLRSKRSQIALSRRSCSATASGRRIDIDAFLTLPNEIRLRLLQRAIDRVGHEGPAELGKVEDSAATN